MDFQTLPDEVLEDIFACIHTAELCYLRRCCRRWNRLLRSPYILRKLVFYTPNRISPEHQSLLAAAIKEASLHLQHVLIMDPAAAMLEKCPLSFLNHFTGLPATSHRVMIVRNMVVDSDLHGYIHRDAYRRSPTFHRYEIKNARFTGDVIRCILIWTGVWATIGPVIEYPDSRFRDVLETDLTMNFQPWISSALVPPALRASGAPAYLPPMTTPAIRLHWAQMLARSSLDVLTAAQMDELNARLATFSPTALYALLSVLLTRFASDRFVITEEQVDYLDYSQFSGVICRLLYLWNGQPIVLQNP